MCLSKSKKITIAKCKHNNIRFEKSREEQLFFVFTQCEQGRWVSHFTFDLKQFAQAWFFFDCGRFDFGTAGSSATTNFSELFA
jgi:hypothetical protein